jgi:hypothetical protein
MTHPVTAATARLTPVRAQTRRADHAFFTLMSIAMVVVVFTGFSLTYFKRIADGSATPLIHIHGAVFAAWMVLFVLQAALVAGGNTRLHRRIGVAGVFFAALMLMVGAVTGVIAARHGYHGNPPASFSPLSFLLIAPLRDLLVFGSLTGAAIVLNRDVASHKRLMLMATLGGLVPAGLPRVTGPGPMLVVVLLVLLLAGPVYDWLTHRRVYGAYVWGIAVTILTTAAFTLLAETSGWQTFAQSLVE